MLCSMLTEDFWLMPWAALFRYQRTLCKFRIVRNENWAQQPTNTSPWQICSCSIIWVGGVTETLRQLAHWRFNGKHAHADYTVIVPITTFAVCVKTTVIKICVLPTPSIIFMNTACCVQAQEHMLRHIVLSTQTRLRPHSHTMHCLYQFRETLLYCLFESDHFCITASINLVLPKKNKLNSTKISTVQLIYTLFKSCTLGLVAAFACHFNPRGLDGVSEF